MITITKEELEAVLAAHKKWIRDEEGGVKGDLAFTDLAGFDLRWRDLRMVNFRGSNFQGSDLRNARLDGADFSYTKLQGADFRSANICNTASLLGAEINSSTRLY